jgi:hypothetical protein
VKNSKFITVAIIVALIIAAVYVWGAFAQLGVIR